MIVPPKGLGICVQSTFERPQTGLSDSDANDPDHLAASLGGLALCRCKPRADETGEHSECESIGAEQRFGKAAPIDSEQLQCAACFRREIR